MKAWNTLRKKYGVRIFIVMLSMLFLCTFISSKEGYHMDEILAFQLANAEYNPWIVPTQPVGRLAKFMAEHIDGETVGETVSNIGFIVQDTLKNRGTSILGTYKADVYDAPAWISREMFQDYVRCDYGDDFNLLSVYFNVKDDNHPPLHFMLLHLMTSVFKGEISVWHGCVINLAAMAGVLWLLGLIGDIVFKKKSSIYALMILAGFSMGMVATTIWIRMYALLTLWTLWGLYLHLRKYARVNQDSFCKINSKTGKVKWIGSVGLFVVTLLSFWTQYFGLFFILPLAFVTVIMLAKSKRMQELWAYVRTMAAAAVVGVCVYPFAIGDVFFSDRGTEALSQWQNGLAEYVERLKAFGSILAENVAGNAVLFAAVLLIPAAAMVTGYFRKGKKAGRSEGEPSGKSMNWWQLVMCGVPTLVYFLLAAKMSPYFVDRYIMAIFPITALLIVWLWDRFADLWAKDDAEDAKTKKIGIPGIVCPVSAFLLVVIQNVNMQGQHEYLYIGYEEQLQVAEEYGEYPMVCLYPGYSFYENVMEMEQYSQTILVKEEELELMDETRTEVTKDGYVVLIKYPGDEAGKEQLTKVMEAFGGTEAALLYEGGAFGDAIYFIGN